ncbi:rhamnulokinase [Streptomyces iranensis]|uniref:Carbohydrate kinase, FGGY n=1 Tax=Streptomyces iranensis TaxID=576784 RepID=A0A060ZGN0_9ACTN|nr:rhamnulokinase family protein [Streptomyces iranensis]MBP2066023.1 rhamnulokinase [Streptomyces iranensis]CDR04944.1 Carbohydrate kinase, FGGY [Streptomyces iranensis]
MPATEHRFAAVDLGASSGRVIVGEVAPGRLALHEAHRFPNQPTRVLGTLHWDILSLYQGVLNGLKTAAAQTGNGLTSIGIDTWAVDYGLLAADGTLLANPVHYRDTRTTGAAEKVAAALPPRALYAATGIQRLPFNTIYQLIAAQGTPTLTAAHRLLLIPDLISYWLTGELGTELTNASTTQLIDPRTRDWAAPVAQALGIDLSLFPPLRRPGDPAGTLRQDVLTEMGTTHPIPVTAVGSHDTASAVVGVPATTPDFAYIATGTWSLAGLELDAPVLTEESRAANFTNELGVDGTVRYLRNIMGLWMLQECVRTWNTETARTASTSSTGTTGSTASTASSTGSADLTALLRAAAQATPLRSVVDAGDPAFIAPHHMPDRIADACRRTGQPVPRTPAETTRCVLDSLALAHRRAIEDATRLSGRTVSAVHIVGGGVHNTLLCQLTADACGLPVIAGPAEAAALGNVLVQARTAGAITGGLPELRALLHSTQPLRQYEPTGDHSAWDRAAARFGDAQVTRAGTGQARAATGQGDEEEPCA